MENYIVPGLCTFTIVYLVKYTDGPFDIFFRFRIFVGLDLPVYVEGCSTSLAGWEEDDDPDRFFAKLIHCFWCFSTWVSFAVSLAYILVVGISYLLFPFIWLFAIGMSGIIYTIIED